jgi:hypothetical protein
MAGCRFVGGTHVVTRGKEQIRPWVGIGILPDGDSGGGLRLLIRGKVWLPAGT